MRCLVFAGVLVSMLCSRGAVAANDEIAVDATLRDTGYMLGDLLDEHVTVHLPRGMTIDSASLPLPGRVAPWLEVRKAELGARDASGQALTITYQIFAESEQAVRAALPELRLRAQGGGDVRLITIPARTFLLSPSLPPSLTDQDRELRPSLAPEPVPQSGVIAGAAGSLLLVLACAGYLLWRYDRLPFLRYAPGPLARAWRRWRRRRRGLEPDQHAALLRDLHAALSGSAGETLYPSTLDLLFVRAPYLAPLRERIEAMFDESWRSFYEARSSSPPPAAHVLELLREAADRERGVPC
ncbi:MAG TPA: hypothetical protein VH375_01745 [Rhodanobacteraceae bacterium]